MSKSRLFSGKIKKLGSTKLTADRYEYLDTSQAEPDLGPPNLNGSVLTGSTTTNIRNWSEILTVEGATVRIRSTLSNIGFYTPNALVVDGGIGVGGDINILGKALINNVEVLTTQSGLTSQFGQSIINLTLKITTSTNSTGTSSGALVIYGGVGINKDVYIGGTTFAGNIYSNGSLVGSSTGTTSSFLINNLTQSTSTTTGALIVSGGLGVAKNLYVGGALFVSTTSYIANSQIITTATINDYATKTIITAGTDTAVNTSTGFVTIWNTSTLQSVTNRGNSTTNAVLITNSTPAIDTSTGALIVSGGVGVGGALFVSTTVGVGGALFVSTTSYIANSQIITTSTINDYATKTIITAGTDTAVNTSTGFVTIWNTSTLQTITDRGNSTTNAVLITNSTPAIDTATGALIVSGGVGVGGALFVSTTSYIANSEIITTATINQYANQTAITAGTDTAVNTSTGNITIWNTSTLQTITDRGNSTTNAVLITNSTQAVDVNSGALVISGGVGIGGTTFAGDIYSNNQRVITTATVNDYADKTIITAGTDTAVNTSTGNITIWNNSNLESITNRGNSTPYTIILLNNSQSTSTTTGALTVSGGVGIEKNLYIGGNLNISTGSTLTIGGQSISQTFIRAGTDTAVNTSTGNVTVWNTSTLQTITDRGNSTTNAVLITNTSTSTTPSTGALIVTGGVGIGQNLYVGNKLAVLNTLSSTSSIYQNAAYIEGGLGVGKSLYVTGPAVFQNNVTFLGTTTYVLTTNTVYTDNLIELHYPNNPENAWTFDDNLDIGFRFHYYDAGDKNAGLVLSGDEKYLEWYSRGNEDTTSSFTGSTYGTFKTGNIILTNTTTSTSTTTGALTVNGGVGVGGNLNVGGDIVSASGNITIGGNIVAGGVRNTSSSTSPAVASIGDIWYNTNNDRLYRYTSNAITNFWLDLTGQKVKYLKNLINLVKPSAIEYLVVAGGGGGGTGIGGGGGGGGVLSSDILGTFSITLNTTYVISVGSGGPAGASLGAKGINGDSSSFDTLIASGGGGGGAFGNGNGQPGGSGGGGSSTTGGSTGGSALPTGQGNAGGSVLTYAFPYLAAGGGGGAAVGANGGGTNQTGNGGGGQGYSSNISGNITYYAGGGGGGLYGAGSAGQGGIGGGGNGSSGDVSGSPGIDSQGGGGGGNSYSATGSNKGGKGIVIVRYPVSNLSPASVTGATIVINNGYRIYTWNSSGTITF